MKNFILALLAVAGAIAFVPLAPADSFSYASSGSSTPADRTFDPGPGGFANGGNQATGASEYFTVNSGTPITFSSAAYQGGSHGFGANSLMLSGDGILDRGGVVVDISGGQISLLTGSFKASGNGHFYFVDNGSFGVNTEVSKGKSELVAAATKLTEAPEPGSLFLLGTGLLGLALVLFRKAAKPLPDLERAVHSSPSENRVPRNLG